MVDGFKKVREDGDDVSVSNSSVFGDIQSNDKLQALAQYIKMPLYLKRKVNALKKLLHSYVKVETNFYKEIFDLEKKFEIQYKELWNMRKSIVNGDIDPTDEDCEWAFGIDGELVDAFSRQNIEEEGNNTEKDEHVKGIPNFWLKVMLHNSHTSEMITDADQDILKCLIDVQVHLNADANETGFTLDFYFGENEYFTNRVLTKQYIFSHDPPADSPLEYDGPEIIRCRGSSISWKQGKNITIKIIKKVKKHKNRKEVRSVTKTVKQDSFFNFFDPPLDCLTDQNLDEETAELLQEDFRIGHFIRESMIPRAVLYFTGEAADSDEESEDLSVDDDDDEDDEGDATDSSAEVTKKLNRNRGKGADPLKPGNDEKPPECQQS